MSKIILSNETEIEILDGSTVYDVMVGVNQYSPMWNILTAENLKSVKIVSEKNEVVSEGTDMVLDREMSENEKGDVVSHFYLREKTEVELLREEVAKLKETSGVHDGAIEDLAVAVSGLAEEGGLA